MGWPDAPPVLTAADVAWWGDNPRSNTRDLFWWMHETFHCNEAGAIHCEAVAARVLAEVFAERYGKAVSTIWGFIAYCRQCRASKAWLAACWNEMLHRLVYDIAKASRKDPGWESEN